MTVRAFVAAFPERAEQERLFESLHAFRRAHRGRGHRWVPPENYHLTFRFLGSIEETDVPLVQEALAPVAAMTRRCVCTTEDVAGLPNARRPRVIAVSITSRGTLETLGERVQASLAPKFGRADRPFLAHLTVIRCDAAARVVTAAVCPRVAFVLATLGLYRSETRPTGARYTPFFELPLRQPAEP